jgi:hypothetical protein
MSYREVFSQRAIALSISESADLAAMGLADEHLLDMMTELARHLLALGARLVYGGDLRLDGFTRVLMELAVRHRRDADLGDLRPSISNVLAWPVFARTPTPELARTVQQFGPLAELIWLGSDNAPHVWNGAKTKRVGRTQMDAAEWGRGLTAMRQYVTSESDARIVLGGRRSGFRGRMPGVIEEALLAMEASKPLYVLGGYGGCAGDLCTWMGLSAPRSVAADDLSAAQLRYVLNRVRPSNLRNGLNIEENRVLASTVHPEQAIALILTGLARLSATDSLAK